MKIILGITGILLITVFSVAYLYFSNLNVNSRSNDKTLAGIPADASVIFQFSNDISLYDIFRDYTVFDAITGAEKKKEISWLKYVLINNEELHSSTLGQKFFISFHPSKEDNISLLWLMPLKEDLKLSDAEIVLRKEPQSRLKIAEEMGFSFLEIKNNDIDHTFYLSIDRGIATGSFSKALLLESLDKDSKKISPEFITEINNSIQKDQNGLANLFINYSNPGFLNSFFKQKANENFSLFNSFYGHSSLSMNYKSDALMFNGITRIANNEKDYITIFMNQKPVKNTIKKIIPYNLSNYISFGVSDYPLFHNDLKQLLEQRNELKAISEQIQLMTSETGINPDRDIKKLWGNEFSTLQLSTYETLAIIRISNGRQMSFFMEPISSMYSDAVRKLNYANLFYYYFGDPLKKFVLPFYAVTDNLIIISNSPVSVQRFLRDYNSERLLYNTEAFTQFDQLVSDQSNISFLIHFDNSESLLKRLLKKNYSDIFKSSKHGIKDFYGLSYQLTNNQDHFFTNFYLGSKKGPAGGRDSLVYNNDKNTTN